MSLFLTIVQNNAEETRNALIEHDRTLAKHDVSLADMDSKIKEMENTSYNGILIWKVENYHSKKNAMDRRPYTSPIFFTSRYGYKVNKNSILMCGFSNA